MKILIIEDEPSLRETMQVFLEKERYVVETAACRRDALGRIADYDYDCILLDVMLPDGDGMTVLEELRRIGKQGNVIIVSAKDSTADKVAGLELGADDYLAKPFHLAELNARIRSVIRRRTLGGRSVVEFGNVSLDSVGSEVYVGGVPLELNRKEYDILSYFIARPGHIVNKTTLAEAVWGDHIDQTDNYDFIYAQVKNLRKKLKDSGAGVELKAVYGFGYKLSAAE